MRYPNLPHLTPDEFEMFVRAARAPKDLSRVISDIGVAMARAVLIDGYTYKQAALAHGKSHGTAAHQTVALLLRYWQPHTPVHPHAIFSRTE